jgi:uncharacterized alkaline shock family protein YloU
MTGDDLSVGSAVIGEMIRLAALEVPGVQRVGHAGPPWRRLFSGGAVRARVHDRRVGVRVSVVARPGHPLMPVAADARSAVSAAVERLLGMEPESVTVIVDGVGT